MVQPLPLAIASQSIFQHLASYLRQIKGLKSPSKLISTAITFQYLHTTFLESLDLSALNQWTSPLPLQLSITRGKLESTSTEERFKKPLGLNRLARLFLNALQCDASELFNQKARKRTWNFVSWFPSSMEKGNRKNLPH